MLDEGAGMHLVRSDIIHIVGPKRALGLVNNCPHQPPPGWLIERRGAGWPGALTLLIVHLNAHTESGERGHEKGDRGTVRGLLPSLPTGAPVKTCPLRPASTKACRASCNCA